MYKLLSTGFIFAFFLLCFDIASFYVIVKLVHAVRLDHFYVISLLPLFAIIATTVFLLYIFNTYQLYRRPKPLNISLRAFASITVAGMIIASILYTTKATDSTTVFWRGNMPVTMFIFAFWTSFSRFFIAKFHNLKYSPTHWVFLGSDEATQQIITEQRKQKPHESVSVVKDDELSILLDEPNFFRGHKVSGIILNPQKPLNANETQDLMHTRLSGIAVYTLQAFCEVNLSKVPVLSIANSFFIFSNGFSLLHHDIALKVKRVIDIILSVFGLLLLSPLLIIVGAINKILNPSSKVLYSQTRCSQHKRPFRIYKFKTMIDNAESSGAQWSTENDPRVTLFGKFLRRTRIDELPQLWNVLKGDMSFIGPRPERPEFVDMLEAEIPYYDIRHIVKPGLTGWAQVMYPYGRSKHDAIRKLEYDLYYIKNYSLSLDIYILIKTLKTVVVKPS